MTPRIKIEVRKIRGPWLDIVEQRIEQDDVMAVITAHRSPRLGIASHASEPEVLPGVWKLTPDVKESTGGVKLIGIQAELFTKDLQGIDGAIRWWRFKFMVDKPGVGFFEIEAVAIVSDGDIATAQQLMEILNQEFVVREVLLITRVVWEGLDRYLSTLPLPAVGEG